MDFKILCTGNPNHQTVASGIKQVFPYAEFACRNTGYDLTMWEHDTEQYFRDRIINYNVLINSSFIANGAQQKILEITKECWADQIGYVFNIGSTAEYEGTRNSFLPHYSIQKRALRDTSLALCSNTFRTTHMTAGGINDGKSGHEEWLNPIQIARVIEWILNSDVIIPIVGVEQKYAR
jgi:hypothetical protein